MPHPSRTTVNLPGSDLDLDIGLLLVGNGQFLVDRQLDSGLNQMHGGSALAVRSDHRST
jgi:hypothetical protein